MVAVPHTREAVRFARNLGHRVPAPILGSYDWNNDTPFKAQKTTAALLTMNDRAFVLSEIGTGKTRAALHALNYLLLTGEIKSAIVVAPLSALVRTWELETFKYFNHLSAAILHGDKATRLKRLAAGADLFIINFDGVETILPELVARKDIGAVVIDELSYYRNGQTARWKAAQRLTEGRPYVWGMTGSPTPNEPSDAYAQIKLLLPSRVPKWFGKFRTMTMNKVSQFRWVAKDDALDTVYAAMQPAVRYRRKDVAELPPTSYQTRDVPLSPEQEKVYKALKAKCHHAFANGEVTALNAGVLASKLLQVASGYVYTTKRGVVSLDNRARLDELLEILDEANHKVIVFCLFRHTLEALFAELQAHKHDVALIHGGISLGKRNQIFAGFQDGASPRIILADPRTMSHSLTLTAADTIVWFTPTASLDTYNQANGRITRPGQTNKTLIIHLSGTPVERRLYSVLEKKESVQSALLEMFDNGNL